MADKPGNEQKTVEALAGSVADRIIQKDVYEATLRALLLSAKADAKEVALETLLRYRGNLIAKRDADWAGIISSIWVTEGTEVPANPHELREMIIRWVSTAEKNIARSKQQEGYNAGFVRALEQGVRLGWGSANAGKGLEETLQAAAKVQP